MILGFHAFIHVSSEAYPNKSNLIAYVGLGEALRAGESGSDLGKH
jgi:hypothetical protein